MGVGSLILLERRNHMANTAIKERNYPWGSPSYSILQQQPGLDTKKYEYLVSIYSLPWPPFCEDTKMNKSWFLTSRSSFLRNPFHCKVLDPDDWPQRSHPLRPCYGPTPRSQKMSYLSNWPLTSVSLLEILETVEWQ